MDVNTQRQRRPAQLRTQERVARAIAAAEILLIERGPEDVSIPDIAEASGVPRASLYQFFANKYQLFGAIAEQHLSQVCETVRDAAPAFVGMHWREVAPILVRAASAYYNQNPVAGILILGWPVSRESYLAQEVTIENIGHEVRTIFKTLKPTVDIPEDPDLATMLVEIAFSIMKFGYYRDGEISEEIMQQASYACVGYLMQILPAELVAS
ncbi:MAG: TetR/AcrR family transcriptional regulator [Paraperlucidibaca sp.]